VTVSKNLKIESSKQYTGEHILELFDVVDEKGIPTGETVERGKAHEDGIRHRTAHIWISREVSGRRQVLLQKRALAKDSFPGRYDTSSAGHIQAGDEPLESAMRELEEELGIKADASQLKFAGTFKIQYVKEFHGKSFHDNEVAFVYVYLGTVDIENITIQKEELDSVEWFDLEDTYQECLKHNPKFCVPVQGLEIARNYFH
jgi:isopentenyldiphosphate isomerase